MPIDDLFPTVKKSDDDPPPTDMFYSIRTQLAKNLIDATKLAIAVGLGMAILFGFITLLVGIRGSALLKNFFEFILPWFSTNPFTAFAVGFLWSFVFGFVFGLVVSLVYNSLVRTAYLDENSWDRLS